MKPFLSVQVPDPKEYLRLKPTAKVKEMFNLMMRKPVAGFMQRVRVSAAKHIRETTPTWRDKRSVGSGGRVIPLAPYHVLYRFAPPVNGKVTSRTGALLEGIREGLVSDWKNMSGSRKLWETGDSFKTLRGTVRGYLTDGLLEASWSTKAKISNDSAAVRSYREAFHYWKWKSPGEKHGNPSADITSVSYHFRHESRGARNGVRRFYFLPAAKEELPSLEKELSTAWNQFLIAWSKE